MAIPYYSMDLNAREIFSVLSSLLLGPFEGPAIEKYEQEIRTTLNCRHVITTPSGRAGFYYVLESLFKPGDEVILSIYSFPLFVRLLHEKGVKPVFVDIESSSALIDPRLIEAKITPKTKGLLVTHLFGNPCEMDLLVSLAKRYELYLLEDCAHAFKSYYKGKPLGTFGDVGIFSTSPMKVPTTLGGGFIITPHDNIAQTIRDLLCGSRQYVYHWSKLYKLLTTSLVYSINSFPAFFSILTGRIFKHLELNNPGKIRHLFYSQFVTTKPFDPFERLRFSQLQARIGLSQLKRFDAMTSLRRNYAAIYRDCFKGSKAITLLEEKKEGFNNDLYLIARVSPDCGHLISAAVKKGVFLMREDCWNCNDYAFSKNHAQSCEIGQTLKPALVRIPNSSLLSEEQIRRTAQTLLQLADSRV